MDLSQLERHLQDYPESPIFARLAAEYLGAGKSAEATVLCHRGLTTYPHYATAHLILARCHAADGNYALALSSLEEVAKLIPEFQLYERYYTKWTADLASSALSRVEPQEEPAPSKNPEEDFESRVTTETAAAPPEPLAGEISGEELAQIQRPPSTDSDEWRIVSRTLAEIFATQGEFEEAIVTYRLLIQERPELEVAYQGRIEELLKLQEAKLLEQREQNEKSPGNAGLL